MRVAFVEICITFASVGRQNLQLVFGKLLLLYQMPKAGSQTLEATLQSAGLPHRILRFHFLSPQSASEIRRCAGWEHAPVAWRSAAAAQLRLLSVLPVYLRLRRLLCGCGVPIPKLEVVTAVREVIGAALSSIFQNYRLFVPRPELLTAEKCRELLARPKLCAQFQNWFEAELQPYLGIDVFATPFPHRQRFCLYENRFARVLLYRFDALPSLPAILAPFLGYHIPSLSPRNVAAMKEYATSYQHARHNLALDSQFIRQHTQSRLMCHFFSPAERAALQKQWGNGVSAPAPDLLPRLN